MDDNAHRRRRNRRARTTRTDGEETRNQTIEGPQVAVLWRKGDQIALLPKQPGKVEEVSARDLAAANPGYKELAALGDTGVLTILLNEDYTPLTKFLQPRRAELSKIG